MTFYSLSFLLFFLFFTALLSKAQNVKIQNALLLFANVLFYALCDYRFLLLLFLIITMCYVFAILFEKSKNKLCIRMAVVICVIVLGVFKYFDFFSESFAKLFGITNHFSLNLLLPLGISFYLFQAMSYLFDVMYGKILAERDFVKLAVYISFFPQITAGPIVKARAFLPQLDRLHKVTRSNLFEGVQLFMIGLTKKVVFADRIGIAVDAVYNAPAAYNGISILGAIIGYSFQIYCDFSGYSNMAIGIAKIWDFDLGENFNAPYIASNPSDFWRRWHISLSTWFRDYVYIPLGGNRKGKLRTYFNLFFTMVLSGIWHGANITYIIWGIVHGLASVLHKMKNDFGIKKLKYNKGMDFVRIGFTFAFVSMAWVVFRANDIGQAFEIYASLLNLKGIMYINVYVVIYAAILVCFNILARIRNHGNVVVVRLPLDRFLGKVLVALWAWAIVLFMYCGNSAFIYAQF